jgi:hypothetical protein
VSLHLLAPLLAAGTYSISEQIARSHRCSAVSCRAPPFGNLMVFALI